MSWSHGKHVDTTSFGGKARILEVEWFNQMILKNSLLDSMFSLSFLSHEIWKVVGQTKEKQPSLLIVMRKRSNLLHEHNSSGCL